MTTTLMSIGGAALVVVAAFYPLVAVAIVGTAFVALLVWTKRLTS